MTSIKFISYNVCGINTPTKRHKILKEVKQYKAGVVFLQETHISHDVNVRLFLRDYPTWFYGDSTTRRAKGLAIGQRSTVHIGGKDDRP